MFDSVLGRGAQPPRVFVRGALVSILAHGAVLGAGVYLSVRTPKVVPKLPKNVVMFAAVPPLPPPQTPAPAVHTVSPQAHHAVKKTENVVEHPQATSDIGRDAADTHTEDPQASTCGGLGQPPCGPACGAAGQPPCGPACGGPGQAPCGPACGAPGQPACAPVPAPATTTVMSFISGMTRPSLLSGEDQPRVPREALLAKVEGTILAQCTITTAGEVTQCRLIKSLPYMDDAVLSNLEARKYAPVIYQGQPVAVKYLFTFHIVQQ